MATLARFAAVASVAATSLAMAHAAAPFAPSFVVANDEFMLDGAPIILRAGSLHLHRLHPTQWADRMGLNSIQTFITWNWHEASRGVVDLDTPARNISAFLEAAADAGLLVLLRAGPYVCGETDGGGLPAHLLTAPGLKYRTNSTVYLSFVDAWWRVLLTRVKPYMRSNGGPVAMVQLENEFGSYGNTGGVAEDKAYMLHLRDLALSILGSSQQLYTTDGGDVGYLSHGALPGQVFATGDGNGPPEDMFKAAATINPPGWRANTSSELYPGWLTHWGEAMSHTSSMVVAADVSAFLALNASFDLYMAFGGTNWGFFNGANGNGVDFQPVITSYDYDAPIQEGGGHGHGADGDKYAAIQTVLRYWAPEPSFPPEPPTPAVTAYGPLALSLFAPLWGNQAVVGGSPVGPGPLLTMEALNMTQGYALYLAASPVCATPPTAPVAFASVSDFAAVFGTRDPTDSGTVPVGLFYRPELKAVASPPGLWSGACAYPAVLLENCGHINYGHGMDTDTKGFSGLSIAGAAVTSQWVTYPLPMRYSDGWPARLPWAPTPAGGSPPMMPAFYKANFTIAGAPTDTYLALCGWGKGQVWINGVHIGRFWDTRGPQHTLYVPYPLLHTGSNEVMVFEVNVTNPSVTVEFVATPDFSGPVCQSPTHTNDDAPMLDVAGAIAAVRAGATHAEARARATIPLSEWRRRRLSPPSAPKPRAAACAAPHIGLDVTLQPCDAGTQFVSWTLVPTKPGLVAGRISLTASPTLCVVVNGTNPDTGTPNLALGACMEGDRAQDWLYFEDNNGVIMSPTRGTVIDAPNNDQTPGTRLELYASNGGYPNQKWTWSSGAGGQIVSGMSDHLCIAAC